MLTEKLQENISFIKDALPAEDIIVYRFRTQSGTECAAVYADGLVDKAVLGDLAARPLIERLAFEDGRTSKDDVQEEKAEGGAGERQPGEAGAEKVKETLLFPEIKEETEPKTLFQEILDGNCLFLVDGIAKGFIVGAKKPPVRAVAEPPTDVAVKGPREGFIEDIKTNMALLRKRLKTPDLRFEMSKVGRRSETNVAVCWLEGISDSKIKDEIVRRIREIDIDYIPDSSYIADFLVPRKHSFFRQIGTTEKPDVFAAKLAEGRIGIFVDGSPIALTAPFIFLEDFQSGEDYYVSPFMATILRAIRFVAVFISLLLPAFYVSSQLFKMQLIPLGLTLTIASSIQGLPLSPSLEMFLVLLVLEVLKEASIRMPKYVGMALSVVGALVLGEASVSAGFVSTPAIIIVAFSGICLYTVPNFIEAGSILRWLFLLVAGSIGPFGIVLLGAFLLYYLLSADAFGMPLLAPFTPLVPHDLKDSLVKYNMQSLKERPALFRSPNRVRLRSSDFSSDTPSDSPKNRAAEGQTQPCDAAAKETGETGDGEPGKGETPKRHAMNGNRKNDSPKKAKNQEQGGTRT